MKLASTGKIVLIGLLATNISIAAAAPSSLKLTALPAPSIISLQNSVTDQVGGIVASDSNLFYFGSEGGAGFVAERKNGSEQWRSPLPNASWPAAATADGLGGIWVVGMAPTPTVASTPTPWPSGTINLGNVIADTSTATSSELSTLTVWHVNASGAVVESFSTLLPAVAIPSITSVGASGFNIQGAIASGNFAQFKTTFSYSGKFSRVAISTSVTNLPSKIYLFKLGNYSWKIAQEFGVVADVPNIKFTKPTWVAIKSKAKRVVAIYRIANNFLAYDANSKLGLWLLTSGKSYYLTQIL
jgi:hypothetical protein